MEQVAASTHQKSDQQMMPKYNLPSQIHCRVMNLILSAEPDSDEVYAQIALLSEPEGSDVSKEDPPPPPKRAVRMFTKILTASDTSTHGGFSVLRKHAEDCLPPLDMTQDPPSQDLVARDLHGIEWRFRHTYRGHPRRHLLTTGWSVFVSQKRLVAGDAVIFLRGENGELRVGIRRTKRQQTTQPSSVLTSHSMHMGVVATASHAVATRTMFSVYYKPRVSPSPFIIPVESLAKAMARNLSVGMRFKMRFETDDASERSYSGTITGTEDMDPTRWPNSKWRSLKVNWDELTINERQDRVSPWEIEPCVSSPAVNPSPGSRSKRFRPSAVLELPALAPGKTGFESPLPSKLPRVLQGQELRNHGAGSLASEEVSKPTLWGTKSEESSISDAQCRFRNVGTSESWMGHGAIRQDMFAAAVPGAQDRRGSFPLELSSHNLDAHQQQQLRRCLKETASSGASIVQPPSSMTGFYSQFAAAPSNDLSSSWLMSLMPQGSTPGSAARSDKPALPLQLHQHPLSYSVSPWESAKQEKGAAALPVVETSGCKIFGFSLTNRPASAAGRKSCKSVCSVAAEEEHVKADATSQPHSLTRDAEMPQASKPGKSDVSSDQEKSDQKTPREVESRNQANPAAVRSCTKVIKKGSMVGRGVDLSKFDSYEKLIEELEQMFHIEGDLKNPDRGWQVAYSDNEGDMMLVGDDPWTEFCSMVRKIHIFSPEEVQIAGLPEIRTQASGGADGELVKRPTLKCSDHEDSSVPALPG